MSPNVEKTSGFLDKILWLVVLALLAVGVVGNTYYADQSLLYRVLGLVALAVIGLAVVAQTVKGKSFITLLKEARTEIRKVVWPTRQELLQTTFMVVVFVLIVALLLWLFDSLISWVVSGFIG
jgi:preprotein translocase subunit SecE